jgi:hypothetical protein
MFLKEPGDRFEGGRSDMSIIVCHVFFLSILYVVHIDRRFENLCRCAPSRWLQTQIESRCVRNDWFGRRGGGLCFLSAGIYFGEHKREGDKAC